MKWIAILLLAAILILSSGTSAPLSAATFTPTPTLEPILPTPTSYYGFFRVTPTPFPVGTPLAAFDVDIGNLSPEEIADTTINVYRFFDSQDVLEYVFLAMLALLIMTQLIRLIAGMTKGNT